MKKSFFIIAIIVLSVFTVQLKAQDLLISDKSEKSNSYLNIKSKVLDNGFKSKNVNLQIEDIDSSKLKSPILGGLLSAIVPGSGQLYAKNYLKSAIFIAAEAGLWVVYAVFQGKGNDQTTTYQNYANGNWNMRKYAQWLKDQSFTGANGIDLGSNDVTLRPD